MLRRSPKPSGAKSGALSVSSETHSALPDPRLAVIVDGWPALPDVAKSEILAIVETAIKHTK
jgi:hypothetical protein